MNQIIKCFLSIFFIFLLLVIGMSISTSMINTVKARNFKADAITKIENSDFYYEVINECMSQAKKNDYELEMNIYTNNMQTGERNVANVISGRVTKDMVQDAYMTELILKYKNQISILGIETQHRSRGYAR